METTTLNAPPEHVLPTNTPLLEQSEHNPDLANALADAKQRAEQFFDHFEELAQVLLERRAERFADYTSREADLSDQERSALDSMRTGMHGPALTFELRLQGVSYTTREQLASALERLNEKPDELKSLVDDVRQALRNYAPALD